MRFAYEAMTGEGRLVHDRVEAGDAQEAALALRGQGLVLLSLHPETQEAVRRAWQPLGRVRSHDIVLLARQMKMLLESGAPLVPALAAVEQQSAKPAFREACRAVREHVERGGRLAEGFQAQPNVFGPVFCSIVAAGEASGNLAQAFDHIATLLRRQQRARKALLGAVVYPTILAALSLGVVVVLLTFVVPRFKPLFESFNRPLPGTTRFLLALSDGLLAAWPFVAGAGVALVVGLVLAVRTRLARDWASALLLEMPLVGRLASRVALAPILRIWAALLKSRVPLLEAIAHSTAAVRTRAFLDLLHRIEESISQGGRIGRCLAESRLVDPVIASAIATGEENGRLAEAVEFVADWVDEDNAQLIATATRVAEPVLLSLIGLIVGAVAMALFIPLFDVATAARNG